MNDIAKEALFRRCADQCDTTEMMSRDMVGYQTEFEEFQRLHREIEDADLEDEYQEWRKANGYIKWEEIREIPKLLMKEEFESELENIKKALEEHNFSSRSFKIHYLIGWVTTGTTIHTPNQLEQIFDLAIQK